LFYTCKQTKTVPAGFYFKQCRNYVNFLKDIYTHFYKAEKIVYCNFLNKFMPLPSTAPSANLNWNKFVPDIILMLLYIFCLDPLMQWQQQHLVLSCNILMLLNIAAVGLGCFIFFSLYADEDQLKKFSSSLSSFEGAVVGLSTLISCLAFCWWLVPFAAVKKMGVTETGFIIGATVYFITFMGVVANSISNKKGLEIAQSPGLKTLNNIITILFFFFSYAFLLMTMQHWHPGFIAAPYLAIFCLFAFYLPLRFFLLLRPPFHKLEYVTFILSFGVLMIRIFESLK
jgi:hypothetical protein